MEDSAIVPARIVLTVKSMEELKEHETDLINQGWSSEGAPVENPDGTFSVTLQKIS